MSILVLSRKLGEQVQIGDDITITVVRITNQGVRIGIEAPRESVIARAELTTSSDDGRSPDKMEPPSSRPKNDA